MGRKVRLSARDRRGAKHRKAGSKNTEKAAARDKSAADAAAAEQEAAAEAMAGMASPATDQQASPATDVKPRPNTAQQEARRREAVVWKLWVTVPSPARIEEYVC